MKDEKIPEQTAPIATVVIPAYNEEDGISGVVRHVKALPMEFELIVVDDGSKDATPPGRGAVRT
jgi:glycosyltransferase involved in cell wall biosynthesis